MIHIGKNTKSKIVSKGISAGQSKNSYRGLVSIAQMLRALEITVNVTQC